MLERVVTSQRELTCTECWVRSIVIVHTFKDGHEEFCGCARCGKTTWVDLPDIGQPDAEQLHRAAAMKRDLENRMDAMQARATELAMRDFDREAREFFG